MNQQMNCATANQLDLVDYLEQLGFKPAKVIRHEWWYHSPFRSERTPSFKINRVTNRWHDFGEGTGGTLVDFGIRYHHCNVAEFLKILPESPVPIISRPSFSTVAKPAPLTTPPVIRLVTTRTLQTLGLIHYLQQRRIPLSVARPFCQEVVYEVGAVVYTALGFKNDAGGYELRSARFKGAMSPKSPTSILSGHKRLFVFEGMFDFLTYVSITQGTCHPDSSYLILNSLAFLEKSKSAMENFGEVRLFLDHDEAGRKATTQALDWGNYYSDDSHLYRGYKDLNEWAQEIGKGHRQKIKL